MSSQKPVILFVHGQWHTLKHYQTFLDILGAKGYTIVAPDLPSSLDQMPKHPAEADIELFSDTARKLADEGNEILAVAHSYGGVVATEAFSGLGIKTRREQGLPGGICSIICIAGFLLGIGMTLEGSAPAEIGDQKILLPDHDIGAVFYPELSKDEQQKWLEHLVKAPKSTSFYSPKKLSYTEIDTVFVYCEKDMAFPYPAQKAVIQAMKSQGLQFQEESLPSGHFPSLSMPDRLADIIVKYISVR